MFKHKRNSNTYLAPQKKSGNERCVLCHKLLDIDKDTPINLRHGYIEGAGQLCVACFATIRTSGKNTVDE